MRKQIVILNGPNLNMLGKREPQIYGTQTLGDIENMCKRKAKKLNLAIDFRQSNSECELIEWIQKANENFSAIIINPAAFTHSSIAIRDALAGANLPIIEVHLSNIYKREEFRHHSFISPIATGIICGLGTSGYLLALEALAEQL